MTPSSSSNGGSMHQKQPPANVAMARSSPPAPSSAATAVLTSLIKPTPPLTGQPRPPPCDLRGPGDREIAQVHDRGALDGPRHRRRRVRRWPLPRPLPVDP